MSLRVHRQHTSQVRTTTESLAQLISSEGLAAIKTEPGYAERNQAWLDRLAKRNEERWPVERRSMLEAAQRAEDMRNRVLLRLVK